MTLLVAVIEDLGTERQLFEDWSYFVKLHYES